MPKPSSVTSSLPVSVAVTWVTSARYSACRACSDLWPAGFSPKILSWRWVFYINVPIGIVALFIIAAVLHIPAHRVHHKIDWLGISFLSAGVTSIILLTTWAGSQYAWGSPEIIGLALLGVAFLIAFCVVETKAAEPIIPLKLFRGRTFSAASGVGFIIGFAMFGAIVYLPLYLQTVHGASPTASGLELLPLVAGMLTTFIFSGRLVTRTGRYKIFPIVGSAVLAVGLVMLSRLGPHTSFALASVYMVVVGLGVGLVMQVLVVAVQNAVPYSQARRRDFDFKLLQNHRRIVRRRGTGRDIQQSTALPAETACDGGPAAPRAWRKHRSQPGADQSPTPG